MTDTDSIVVLEPIDTIDIPTQQLQYLQKIAFDFDVLLIIIGVLIGSLIAFTICKIVEKVINNSIF